MTARPHSSRSSTLSGLAFLTALMMGSPAWALDTTLDNITINNGEKGTISLPKVEVTGTNLSQDELAKLFSATAPEAERKALIARFQASKLAIPTALVTNKSAKITLSGFTASGIDAGKVADASLTAIDGNGTTDKGGPVTIKSGAIMLKGADLLSLMTGETESMIFSAFSLDNLAITAPDDETPASAAGGNLIKLAIASIVGNGTFEGNVPTKGQVSIKGLTIEPPPASKSAKELVKAGMGRIELGFDAGGTYDIASQTYSVDELKISTGGLGALNLRAKLTGIPKEAVAGKVDDRLAALMQGKASSLELIFDDAGLVEKLLVYFAAQQGKTPAALRTESAMMSRQMIPVLLGGAANANAIAEQVGRFVDSPKQLSVVLRPKNGPISVPEMIMLSNPPAFLQAIDVQVTSTTGAAPTAAPQLAQSQAAPAVQTGRLTGAAAWNTLIGKTIAGKNDDGDPLFEYFLADGTAKQLDDTDVYTGKWSIKKDQVCLEYSYSDEETCYRVVVDGDTATFTDVDGDGKRYQILAGNPKKL